VSSINRAVIVSPASKIASSLLGSSAINDVNDGPALSPKLPVRAGERDIEARDVPTSFLRLADPMTVNVRPSIVGAPPVESKTVIVRTDGLDQVPT